MILRETSFSLEKRYPYKITRKHRGVKKIHTFIELPVKHILTKYRLNAAFFTAYLEEIFLH